jgi:sugar lactone lactonase YvrE
MKFEAIDSHRCQLGEGAFWSTERRQLLYVDIHRGDVLTWSPGGVSSVHRVADRVSFVIPTADGGLAIGLRHGISGLASLDAATGDLKPAIVIEADKPDSSVNDARCDPRGQLWFGTVDRLERKPVCGLYTWTPERGARKIISNVSASNGIRWSPSGDTMYYVDSVLYRLDAFEYDQARGELGERRTIAKIDPALGLPDGINVDAEGVIYVVMHGGSAIRCYRPDGALERVIALPVRHPASCVFGGDDLRTLFVTSGASHVKSGESGMELEGAVLAAASTVAGLPSRPLAATLEQVLTDRSTH